MIGLLLRGAQAGDWPTYRADAARSGYTSESLPTKLSLQWTHQPRYKPQPAWSGWDTRMPFDHTFHPVIAGGMLYFASSANGKVYALDAITGEQEWEVFTGGPVRFAPTLWKNRLFVASDDGCLYCLAADNGKTLWKKRGGPDHRMMLGNGRMISRWPARGGPAVLGDIVYFAAGIWPSEGIYIYALDAATGEVVWLNDDSGGIEMDQPHGGARAKSGLSAQGYLVATRDRLLIPTGRAVPAALDRTSGVFHYFHLQANRGYGGSPLAATDDFFCNSGCMFATANGTFQAGGVGRAALALSSEYVIYAKGDEIVALDRGNLFTKKKVTDRKGKEGVKKVLTPPVWKIQAPHAVDTSLIVAGKSLVAAGRDEEKRNKVTVFDLASKSPAWSTEVDGAPYGLAVADRRLYVSTSQGTIYCFGGTRAVPRPVVPPLRTDTHTSPLADFAAAAEEIIEKSGVTEGYCLDLGCGDGALACELARRTKLHIYACDPDPKNVASARKRLDAAGLYGVRVTVLQCKLTRTPFPRYFANLIVSGRSVTQGADAVPTNEMRRIQRPFGGVACLGKPGTMKKTVRGPLKGAGIWTHQYCDPANTSCSTDTLVKGPLGMLWFTDNDLIMPSRHGRGPAPLVQNGRLIIEGMNAMRAVDAYNGRRLWEYPLEGILKPYDQEHLMGTAGTNSNFCLANDSVYLRTGGRCLRIDVATGKKTAEFDAPTHPDGSTGTWGYIACVDDTLYGSLVNEKHIVRWNFSRPSDMDQLFTESSLLFALDATTGKVKWKYTPKHSIRHNAIAIGGGRLYLIDRPLDKEDLFEVKMAQEKGKRRGGQPATTPTDKETEPPPPAELIALNAATGDVLWQKDDNIHGTLLALSTRHGVLLMTRQYTRFRLPSEKNRHMTGFRASTGRRIWDAPAPFPKGYRSASRPIINGRTIILEPHAWDLLTGKPKLVRNPKTDELEPWQFSRSYGCGIIAGSKNLMVFRSATLGYVDLRRPSETENYGGIRPGCWINTIPASGLVLAPDATDRCSCSYLIKATIALQPVDSRRYRSTK